MIRTLRFRLAGLCIGVTALVLVTLTLVCLFISERNIRNQEEASFQINLNTLYQNLQLESALSHTWLRHAEYNYQFLIRLTDNGSPLFFQSLSRDAGQEALLDLAAKKALTDYGIDAKTAASDRSLLYHQEFTMKDPQGGSCYVSAGLVPVADGTLSVTVVHPLSARDTRIFRQRAIFFTADLAALLLLGLFFWSFIQKILEPLQENRRRQTQFIAAASHELRSPLTVILSNVEAVRRKNMEPDEAFLTVLEMEGNRMARLVSDMLQLAGADNHSWSMHIAPTELDTLVLETFESFEALAHSRQLLWEVRLPEEPLPRCLCDGERIRQLLSILIDNAFCYTPAGGRVLLFLEASPGALRIGVSDNGPGIPDSEKERVFERFYRSDSSRSQKEHFGLGLSIAWEIARLHRGKLLLTDTPGGGSTFLLILPDEKKIF